VKRLVIAAVIALALNMTTIHALADGDSADDTDGEGGPLDIVSWSYEHGVSGTILHRLEFAEDWDPLWLEDDDVDPGAVLVFTFASKRSGNTVHRSIDVEVNADGSLAAAIVNGAGRTVGFANAYQSTGNDITVEVAVSDLGVARKRAKSYRWRASANYFDDDPNDPCGRGTEGSNHGCIDRVGPVTHAL
jgi:hypothetical protein